MLVAVPVAQHRAATFTQLLVRIDQDSEIARLSPLDPAALALDPLPAHSITAGPSVCSASVGSQPARAMRMRSRTANSLPLGRAA
jgi:hypothetical protein